MSMRIFTPDDFHTELRKIGLSPTREMTARSHIWNDTSFNPVTIPILPSYPDYLLDELISYLAQKDTIEDHIEQKLYVVEGGKS